MNATIDTQMGILPPQSIEMEEAILGACMLEKVGLEKAILLLPTAEVFYKDAHKSIFRAIIRLESKREDVDILTVVAELSRSGELEVVGGIGAISQLTIRVNTSAHIETHCREVVAAWQLRELIRVASQMLQASYGAQDSPKDIAESSLSSISQIVSLSASRSRMRHIAEVTKSAMLEFEQKMRQPDGLTGIPSGIRGLDEITGGFQRSDLICIAGRPGMGKTAKIGSVVKHASINGVYKGIVFSLEMRAEQIVARLMSEDAGVSNSNLSQGRLSQDQFSRLHSQVAQFASGNVYIDDSSNVSLSYIRSQSLDIARRQGLDYIIVDYIQIADTVSGSEGLRSDQQLGNFSKGLKILAKLLNIPVIFLSQLSRDVEKRQDKRPILSDLRDSGQLEQDCDVIIFLYRPEYYGIEQEEDGSSTQGLCYANIAKHRNGTTGDVKMRFVGKYTSMSDWETPLIPEKSFFEF